MMTPAIIKIMPGFHWITVYGDYIKEAEYAFKKIGIGFGSLT